MPNHGPAPRLAEVTCPQRQGSHHSDWCGDPESVLRLVAMPSATATAVLSGAPGGGTGTCSQELRALCSDARRPHLPESAPQAFSFAWCMHRRRPLPGCRSQDADVIAGKPRRPCRSAFPLVACTHGHPVSASCLYILRRTGLTSLPFPCGLQGHPVLLQGGDRPWPLPVSGCRPLQCTCWLRREGTSVPDIATTLGPSCHGPRAKSCRGI